VTAPASLAPPPEEGLHRSLTSRQLSMIAIGGAIGVGLFLGSTVTIGQAGPAVIVSYVIGAAISLVVAYALAEMAVVHPLAGSFGVFAGMYLSPWFGFVVRATYGFIQVLAIGAEVTAVAIYVTYWFPAAPPWVGVVAASALLILINTMRVRRFGEVEYWLAIVKVTAILAFIVVGLALVAGLGPARPIGFTNLFAGPGGFLPHGWTGVWLALTLVITSYMGVEIVAITAGEAVRPAESIPRAMRTMVFRLILFYVLAITVMLMMTPWNQISEGGGLTGSPFVRAFSAAGIPYAASLMNLVVISAAFSSANTNLYSTTRMLFSLSRSGYVPAWVSQVTADGVPIRALALAGSGMVVATLLALISPERGFYWLFGTAVAGMLFIWIVVLFAYLSFRAARPDDERARRPIRLWAPRVSAPLAIVALTAIAVTTFFVDGLRYTVPSFLPFLLIASIPYARARHQNRANHVDTQR
jgi:amino acid transporter, AAT family